MVCLKDKLECAKVRRIETGEYSDPDWFRRTTTRLRHRGREHQALLVEAARRRRAGRKTAVAALDMSRDRVFIRVALKRLPRELFEEIAREAEEVFASGGGGETWKAAGEKSEKGEKDGNGVVDTTSQAVLRWREAMKRLKVAMEMEGDVDVVELMEEVADCVEQVKSMASDCDRDLW